MPSSNQALVLVSILLEFETIIPIMQPFEFGCWFRFETKEPKLLFKIKQSW